MGMTERHAVIRLVDIQKAGKDLFQSIQPEDSEQRVSVVNLWDQECLRFLTSFCKKSNINRRKTGVPSSSQK